MKFDCFFSICQTAELWFKLMLHETESLIEAFRKGIVSTALKKIKRLTAIMDLQVKQINLLSTLTPHEFSGFRDMLRPASGFQSFQFRYMEYCYGIRNSFFLKFFDQMPEVVAELKRIQKQPSVYDEFISCLAQAGFTVPDDLLKRDYSVDREVNQTLIQTIKKIYENPEDDFHWVLLFEALLDFDEKLASWRHTHLLMVARAIGKQQGTGGSTGYDFLKARQELKCFPELWEVRDHIGGSY